MEELDYAPPFQYGVPAAFRLAAEMAQMLPAGLNRVLFAGGGLGGGGKLRSKSPSSTTAFAVRVRASALSAASGAIMA